MLIQNGEYLMGEGPQRLHPQGKLSISDRLSEDLKPSRSDDLDSSDDMKN